MVILVLGWSPRLVPSLDVKRPGIFFGRDDVRKDPAVASSLSNVLQQHNLTNVYAESSTPPIISRREPDRL